jgi:hypothetical protein
VNPILGPIIMLFFSIIHFFTEVAVYTKGIRSPRRHEADFCYCPVAPGLQEAAAKHFDEVFSPKYNEMAEAKHKNGASRNVY